MLRKHEHWQVLNVESGYLQKKNVCMNLSLKHVFRRKFLQGVYKKCRWRIYLKGA